MPAARPPDRLDDLVRTATEVFIEHGYRRTQMSDVATALGVAKGTVYLYVESKDALFDLAVRQADRSEPVPAPARLPVPAPKPGSTVQLVRERLETEGRLHELEAALERRRVTDAEAELERVVGELFDALARNRTGIKLIDRCGADFPELAATFHQVSRGAVPGLLDQYIRKRTRSGHFRPFEDTAVTARMVMELSVFWAVHVHWDRAPIHYDGPTVRSTVLSFTKGALLR